SFPLPRPARLVSMFGIAALALAAAAPDGVRISTLVTDRQGKPVPGLTIKDFELREDGVVQKLLSVDARKPAPRRLAIILDEFHVSGDDSAPACVAESTWSGDAAAVVRDAVGKFVAEQVRADDSLILLKPLDPLTSIDLNP